MGKGPDAFKIKERNLGVDVRRAQKLQQGGQIFEIVKKTFSKILVNRMNEKIIQKIQRVFSQSKERRSWNKVTKKIQNCRRIKGL